MFFYEYDKYKKGIFMYILESERENAGYLFARNHVKFRITVLSIRIKVKKT